jgi:EpsI family protein
MTNKSFTLSLIILLATIASAAAIASRNEPVVVKTNLENLPMEIAGYKATEDSFSDSVYKELNADKHVYRHYWSADGLQVDLYIGYYGTAKGGRTGHNPYACLPGAGWGIVEARTVQLTARSLPVTKYYPNGVEVNYVLARKGNAFETVLHWYQSAGTRILSTGIQQNIQRFFGRLFHNRNDGAFVRISAFSDEDHIKEAESSVRSFALQVLSLLPKYWPLEQ